MCTASSTEMHADPTASKSSYILVRHRSQSADKWLLSNMRAQRRQTTTHVRYAIGSQYDVVSWPRSTDPRARVELQRPPRTHVRGGCTSTDGAAIRSASLLKTPATPHRDHDRDHKIASSLHTYIHLMWGAYTTNSVNTGQFVGGGHNACMKRERAQVIPCTLESGAHKKTGLQLCVT